MTASSKRPRALPSRAEVQERLREILRSEARQSYRSYLEYVYWGRWRPAPHLDLLTAALERVEAGDVRRLIVTMPPRHGKSMSVTEAFPSWAVGRCPDTRVIEVSYGDKLARRFGRANLRKVEEHGPELFGIRPAPDSASALSWDVEGRAGGMVSAGIGGAITGQGADLLIVDDPIKDRKEAMSKAWRDTVWGEWQSTLYPRLHPGGRVVVIMTRWHEDDLVGRLLSEDGAGEWTVLSLPAIAEEGRADPLGREPGAALWPEHGFDEAWAERTKADIGSAAWASLYQGRPTAQAGGLFRASSFRRFRDAGGAWILMDGDGERAIDRASCVVFQTCDVAGSRKASADFFVLATFALAPGGELLLLDVLRERLEGPDQPALMRRKWAEWRPALVGVESANMGLGLYQQLVRDGLPVLELRPETDKWTRALPAAARYEAGAVWHREGAPWLPELEDELLSFPNGAHDDQVDAISYAVSLQVSGLLDAARGGRDRAYVIG